jgi:hypothetical protein
MIISRLFVMLISVVFLIVNRDIIFIAKIPLLLLSQVFRSCEIAKESDVFGPRSSIDRVQ